MEGDGGVRAPVTRLRRRLSVEQSDDTNSPGPATPTKKKGRLAAKPQLELIDENIAPGSASKHLTKKTANKDLTDASDEKALTPSRRSARIKSNTSIVSITTQSYDSPRAKRAARRTSQVGSDTETPLTPARQTRRTRKDSTSSMDKLETTLGSKQTNIKEIIIEETETHNNKVENSLNENDISPSLRKSPRLNGKNQKDSSKKRSTDNSREVTDENINITATEKNIVEKHKKQQETKETYVAKDDNEALALKKTNNILSDTSVDMIKKLDVKAKKESSNVNKSTSALEKEKENHVFVNKRQRTNSLTNITQVNINDNIFFSDNETKKNKSKKNLISKECNGKYSGSGDNQFNSHDIIHNQSKLLNSSKDVSKELDISYNKDKKSVLNNSKDNSVMIEITTSDKSSSSSKSIENEFLDVNASEDNSSVTKTLEMVPNTVQSSVFFEDSSDSDTKKYFPQINLDSGDSIPVFVIVECKSVDNIEDTPIQESGNEDTKDSSTAKISSYILSRNDSCEPMEIDETIPNNICETSQLEKSSVYKKSTESSPLLEKSSNKSKRKSSITLSTSPSQLEKSSECKKSTELSPLHEKSSNKSKGKSSITLSTSPSQLEKSSEYKKSTESSPMLEKISNKSERKSSITLSTSPSQLEKSSEYKKSTESSPMLEKFSNKSKRKSSITLSSSPTQLEKSSEHIKSTESLPLLEKSSSKSKCKSSNTLSTSQNLEKTRNENKSTLIISQIKDGSSAENSVSKSPNNKPPNELLSKSNDEYIKDKINNKKNLSLDYSTSTLLQQKKNKKLGIQINSSIIDSGNNDKISSETMSSKNDESEEETSNSFIQNEAELASDNYESGDSQNEDERQYKEENEILERGETLDSEDEISNDSDYEKDSFVVSSIEEDNELLSGSGDDLSMNDNELTISENSKKKYNERKLKEQKKASKEMFDARHKLDVSKKKPKRKPHNQLESSSDSDDEIFAPVKKNKHQRLDSTHDDSLDQSTENSSIPKKYTKDNSVMIEITTSDKSLSNSKSIQNEFLDVNVSEDNSSVTKILEMAPSTVQSSVFFEDSSDSDTKKDLPQNNLDSGDSIPVFVTVECKSVDNIEDTPIQEPGNEDTKDCSTAKISSDILSKNDSCEPMEIDETIPNNICETSQLEKSSVYKKSTESSPLLEKSSNKSKRKSSITLSTSPSQLEKSSECKKSTESSPLLEKSSNKSKRKSSITLSTSPSQLEKSSEYKKSTESSPMLEKFSNKSKRKSSITLSSSPTQLEKSSEHVKSTESSPLLEKSSSKSKCKSSITLSSSPTQLEKSSEHVKSTESSPLLEKSSSKSKCKSSNTLSTSQNLEKTRNENKSTLIISQIKDGSSAENSVSKSPNNKPPNELLSKSTNDEYIKDKINNKKNLSLDYSTSTPLQQKNKKLGMQINSSIIDSGNNDKKSSETMSSTDDESEEETSNSFIQNEAELASDDYESGDSQNEDERQYKEENEILERGETLDSEDEISNDSDYEKDSFVVSSIEEDDELLSGSGDDLSMNDNELTISENSKKKYNERKLKEQKKASKEMFDARHKLDVSKNKPKRKPHNQLESSSDSDDEIFAPVKKNKHQRLDSTHGDSLDQSTENSSIPKKRRSSESEYNQSNILNKEEEISNIFDENVTQTDPLSMQIKIEPKTPNKGLNISTVQIYDIIEEVEVDENMSFAKTNQSRNTLQNTITKEDDDSSLSENSEIMQNYDSILNELNNTEKSKLKTQDLSLNIIKKNKKLSRPPIADQLNLTNTKLSKKRQSVINSTNSLNRSQNKLQNLIPANVDKDESSDSIDLQLLLSEDSSDLDQNTKKHVANKTEKSHNDNDDKLHFIIDTEGSRGNTENAFDILNTSSKKKKNKSNKLINNSSETKLIATDVDSRHDDDAPLEIPLKNAVNDMNGKSTGTTDNGITENESQNTDAADLSVKGSTKKKKKTSLSFTENTNVGQEESSFQMLNSSIKTKKPHSQLHCAPIDTMTSKELSNSKKRKRKSSIQNTNEGVSQILNTSVSTGIQNKKRKYSENNIVCNQAEKTEKKVNGLCSEKNYSGGKNTSNVGEHVNEQTSHESGSRRKKNKKRKRDDDDNVTETSKVLKHNSFDKVHISRLPASIISQLDDKPTKEVLEKKKSMVVSTTLFAVEETRKRKNKPSNYLEESVYLNDSYIEKKQKKNIKKPKVLPFVPTAATSGSGFTTNFKINIIPNKVEFIAQTKNESNFKNDYLYGKKIKRMGTYELYKKHRNAKTSKF